MSRVRTKWDKELSTVTSGPTEGENNWLRIKRQLPITVNLWFYKHLLQFDSSLQLLVLRQKQDIIWRGERKRKKKKIEITRFKLHAICVLNRQVHATTIQIAAERFMGQGASTKKWLDIFGAKCRARAVRTIDLLLSLFGRRVPRADEPTFYRLSNYQGSGICSLRDQCIPMQSVRSAGDNEANSSL